MMLSMVIFIFYMFFIAIACGMTMIREEETKAGEILNATELTPGEQMWGKFWGVTLGFFAVLGIHVVFSILANHVLPNPEAVEIRGPFSLMNYLKPAIVFGVPTILFVAGITFAIGSVTRKAILVFVVPVVLMLVCAFFLWDWAPGWLDPRLNRVLMLIEPAGFRWLNETWLKVDQGVDFYNSQPVGYDAGFLLSRLAMIAVGLGSVGLAVRRFAATRRGTTVVRTGRKQAATVAPAAPPSLAANVLQGLGMKSGVPGWLAGALTVARFEFQELRSSPGLYLFIPIIVLETVGTVLFDVGPFDTPILLTNGYLAVRTMNTITLLTCLLLLFYTVESLNREKGTGMGNIFYTTPLPTSAFLFGKALANSLVGTVVLAANLLACIVALLVQGKVGFSLTPFVIAWGLVLLPTFLVWSAFVIAVQALTGNRYVTYALGLGALILTGYKQMVGKMTWVFNWDAWAVVRWTDFGVFPLNMSPLLWNRFLVILLTGFLVLLAVRFFDRRQRDATRIVHGFRPLSLLRASLPLLPFVVAILVVGGLLHRKVENGLQGSVMEKRGEDYWKANVATWTDADLPALAHVDVKVDLEPADGWLRSVGSYTVFNHRSEPLRRFPLTAGAHFDSLEWTLDGEAYEPLEKAGLFVIRPATPLAPGDSLVVGWSFEGHFPGGITKNGGGLENFILPAGVVLTSFTPSFCPMLGYDPQAGVDDDNRAEPKVWEDDFYEGWTKAGFGSDIPFTVRTVITGPEEYTLNGVGVLTDERVEGGRRTAVWESDYPVNFFNIVAGKWEVREGNGTAIYYHPDHAYNIDEMIEALDGTRKYFGEWFQEYPWQRLKVSEFAALANYAQGFPTNITFSEGIGFLAKSDPRANTAFLVTAHEAAHQWWGNLLLPGDGPGGNILSEGMAHFSTALLYEEMKGDRGRMEFLKRIEERYGDRRQADSEKPLVWIDGTKPGDTTVTYDKGGWVFRMLLDHMGRENCLAGVRAFLAEWGPGPDHAVLFDFVRDMRPFAPDPDAYDTFVRQWFLEVHVPRFVLHDVERTGNDEDGWTVTFTLENAGTGTVPITVAAERGERFPDEDPGETGETASLGLVPTAHAAEGDDPYRSSKVSTRIGPGESKELTVRCGFEPERLVVDPDVRILQLRRDLAQHRF